MRATLVAWALLWGFSGALAAAEDEVKPSQKTGFWLDSGASFTFDDNVFRFSPEDIGIQSSIDFKVPSFNQQRFNRMQYIGDAIIYPTLGLYYQRKAFEEELGQRYGVDLGYNKYVYNTIKDYPSIRPSLRQYVGDSFLEGYGLYAPNQFDLNYFGRTHTTLRFPGFFTDFGGGVAWGWRFESFPRLELNAKFEYVEHKFSDPELSYRSAIIHRPGASAALRWAEWLKTTASYQFEQLRAERSPALDVSEEQHQWGMTAEITPAPGWRVVPSYIGNFTRYTTSLDETIDPFHAGRRDYLDVLGILLGYRLNPNVDLSAQYQRSENRTNLAPQPSDERLRYVDNAYTITAQTHWDIPAVPGGAGVDIPRQREFDKSGFWTSEGVGYSYDDNVHQLSHEDQAAWRTIAHDPATINHSRFNRMDHIDDHIGRYDIGLYEQAAPMGDKFPNRLGIDLDYQKYSYNPIKDHSTAKMFMRQYLTARHYLEFYYSVAPNEFDRNYLGQDHPGAYFAGNLDARRYGLVWDGLLDAFGGITAGLGTEYGYDHFREPELRYRSAVLHDYSAHLGYHWLDWLYTEARYRFQQLWATHQFIDRSNDQHQWTARVEAKPWVGVTLAGEYQGAASHYTTALAQSVDPFHAGRRDLFNRELFRASYAFLEHWLVYYQYEHNDNRGNLHYVDTDERLRYLDSVYSLGFEVRWDLGVLPLWGD